MKDTVTIFWVAMLASMAIASGMSSSAAFAQAANPASNLFPNLIDQPTTLCSDDDRVRSNDPRVGRLNGGCTAWLIGNGAVLTAGHCVDRDPDKGGPETPDGMSDWIGQTINVEFNVPDSNAAGAIQPAKPEDTYEVVPGSERFEFFGEGVSDGRDWAVFALKPNATTKLTAHQKQGFLRITNRNPDSDAVIRIIGYGVDDGITNKIEQTALGDLDSENNSNGHLWYDYNVDTEGGNSGSPIIWELTGMAIGIHNSGGCDSFLGIFGSNRGSSFDTPNLGPTINNFNGANTVHVDTVVHIGTPNGWIFNPYNTVGEAAAAVPAGGQISIAAGKYDGSVVIDKKVTLIAPTGLVVIGQQ